MAGCARDREDRAVSAPIANGCAANHTRLSRNATTRVRHCSIYVSAVADDGQIVTACWQR
jgi:hypothetical protein